MRKNKLLAAASVLALLALLAVSVGPSLIESRLNRVRPTVTWIEDRATALHYRVFVADLHADTLLWNRNLLDEGSRGHVDVPRLIEGNVALQSFTVVTKTPYVWKMNIERTDDT